MTFDPSAAFETKSREYQQPTDNHDPRAAFQATNNEEFKLNGRDPVLGGKLRERAVWVDERKCIGCTYCSSVATNTFAMEPEQGRARAFRQDGDSEELIQEAVDTCPVDCIEWVSFEDLIKLEEVIKNHNFRNLGLPPVT
ncbi:ferredoxin [Prochlorococcus marinus]|uniref:Ferredoxin n=1 Tax=Prochlorococcus marinus XMU1408 TaxID=2213228 RepID=A0A318QX89_PROMR|nr:ferredoxin [Prochlorococcus marinus]MBW3042651.1 ferredoxin [Prochlorococcus marinus str. XMU1408]PYE01346.1 ferredoxin [Prochlorococcus marinus XMU1408]